MAVAIIGGTGSGFFLKINSDGSINVSGVSVTSSITAGSESFIFGRSGGTWMPLAVQSGTEAILRTTASVSVSVGSESVITAGSVQTYNPIGIGSILITNVTPSPVIIITIGSSGAYPSLKDFRILLWCS